MLGRRTINSVKNIYSGLVFRFGTLFLNFLSRYIFIFFLGDSCLGLNGLFTTILSLFSLAELGIGEAITFYLYKPIAERDQERLCQLISFYKLCYRIIGLVILIIGIALIPILDKLVNLENVIGYNYYLIYLLYLANTVITYLFFSYPQTVLIANQEQYLVNRNSTLFVVLIFIGDLISLSITNNYIVYLSVRLLLQVVQNLRLYLIARKKYSYIHLHPYNKLSLMSIKNMFKDVYHVFIVKLSSKLIDSTDNIFISVFLGTVKVGYNSNYLLFSNAALSIVNTIIYSFSAGVGDLVATESKERRLETFKKIDCINFCISFFCSVCLFSFLNPFITMLWGEKFVFSLPTVALFCFNFYMVTSLNTIFMFRQGMGLFRYYAYNTLFSAILNITLDFLFVKRLGVMGLYLATVISNLLFGVWPFIMNVFDMGFGVSAKQYIKITILRYLYIIGCFYLIQLVTMNLATTIVDFVIRVLITVIFIVIAILIVVIVDRDFKVSIQTIIDQVLRKKPNDRS